MRITHGFGTLITRFQYVSLVRPQNPDPKIRPQNPESRILGVHVRKDACSPREICRDVRQRTDRTVRGGDRVAEVSRGHSSRWKRAGPPENGRSIPGGLTLMKA